MPSRGPPCTTFATKCQPNLSIREQLLLPALDVFGMGQVIIRPSQGAATQMLPKTTTQRTPAEHREAHCKQDLRHCAASLQEQGFHHRPTGDPLHNRRQASDSQLFTSWVSPEQEPRPFHVCPRAVGTVTGWSVSRTGLLNSFSPVDHHAFSDNSVDPSR